MAWGDNDVNCSGHKGTIYNIDYVGKQDWE